MKPKVHLVASSPNGAENLGLEYLAGSLKAAGFTPEIFLFQGVGQMMRLVESLARTKPLFIGVSLPSGEAAIDMLPFVRLLRKNGYHGPVCAGGAFATLARKRLLSTEPLDFIVRHDGEQSIVDLANALYKGKSTVALPGVSQIHGDGLPSYQRSQTSIQTLPLRGKPKRYAGVNSAKISASRGCFGNCTYCGLKALRKDAQRERAVDSNCRDTVWRRSVASIADEMADLYHHSKVRFFHFVDENHLPRNPDRAAKHIHELCDALDERRVTKRAVSMMLRADAATSPVLKALERLGLARCLLGVESSTDEGLRFLRRGYGAKMNSHAQTGLRRTGSMFHYNVLLIHPDSSLSLIKAEVDALSEVRHGLLDPFCLNIYQGTDIYNRLKNEGRLQGGPLLWHFWPEEEGARAFAQLFYRLKRDAVSLGTLTSALYDVLGGLAIQQRMGHLQRGGGGLFETQRDLIAAHNRLWARTLHRLLEYSSGDVSEGTVAALVASIEHKSAHLILATLRLKDRIERECEQKLLSDVTYATTAAAASLAMAVLTGLGCHDAQSVDTDSDTTLGDTVGDTASDTSPVDTDALDTSPVDTGTQLVFPNDSDTFDTEDVLCTYEEAYVESNQLFGDEGMVEDCGGDCRIQSERTCAFELTREGRIVGVVAHPEFGRNISQEYIDCMVDVLSDQIFPCIAEHQPVWKIGYIALE